MENATILKWRQAWSEAQSDEAWRKHHFDEDAVRTRVRVEMIGLLERFLSGAITVEQFRAEFDRRTRTEWDVFGFKGLSGAMFLNKLVKYVADKPRLTTELQQVLRVPSDEASGRSRMTTFVEYLEGLVASGVVTRMQCQTARSSFFVSAWWHVQDLENWPVYYLSGRRALEESGEFEPIDKTIDDYFQFRRAFLKLANALQLDSWACEHLLDRSQKLRSEASSSTESSLPVPPSAIVTPSPTPELEEVEDEAPTGPTHAQIQRVLAEIGSKLGCQVWIAANDHTKSWGGVQLGDLSIDALPNLGLDASSQKRISLIDVVWLKGQKQVVAAFEVEHTTSVFSGLLRMSDLIAESPNLNFPLYLVAPQARLDKVRKELARPTFQSLELHKRCGYFSDESLLQAADSIARWATNPSAIEKLASWVDDAPVIGD